MVLGKVPPASSGSWGSRHPWLVAASLPSQSVPMWSPPVCLNLSCEDFSLWVQNPLSPGWSHPESLHSVYLQRPLIQTCYVPRLWMWTCLFGRRFNTDRGICETKAGTGGSSGPPPSRCRPFPRAAPHAVLVSCCDRGVIACARDTGRPQAGILCAFLSRSDALAPALHFLSLSRVASTEPGDSQ